MSFEIKTAIRSGVRPLIGVAGKSGSGKTKSALLLARGMVGPSGRIVGVDTESRRMSDFAGKSEGDPECEIPGGFKVIDFDPPFSPARCREALELAAQNADIVVWDSGSHEWSGEGGVLQMIDAFLDQKAGDDWAKRDRFKMPAWAKIGLEHQYLFNEIARFPVPLIICFRTKDKIKMEKEDVDGRGKTKVTTEEDVPITRKDLFWEMKLTFLVEEKEDGGGYWRFIKRGTSTLERIINEVGQARLCVAHGESIAKWCAAPTGVMSAPPPSTAPTKSANPANALKKQLWQITAKIHMDVPARLEQWLWDENIISDAEALSELTVDRLSEVILEARKKAEAQGLYKHQDMMP